MRTRLRSLGAALLVCGLHRQAGAQAKSAPALERLLQLDSALTALDAGPFDAARYDSAHSAARVVVDQLIRADSLRTSAAFLIASRLAADGFFENRREQLELALVAITTDPVAAVPAFRLAWDGLALSMGRGQRIGAYKRDGVPVKFEENPAPAAIRSIFTDFPAAMSRAAAAASNDEMRALRDADQADRRPPFTAATMQAMRRNDPLRRSRTMALIDGGALRTAEDFGNAALVFQHGDGFADYALAHELSVAATALGDTTSIWLMVASYDRMLLNLGHRQRFGTQFLNGRLSPLDTTALNDRIRLALHAKPLAALKR